MSLTVKAYLLTESESKEIRRFAVEQDICTNHDYLRQKIVHIFPVLKDKTFSLFWKDAENELISFSSDEEQTEALGFVTDGVFKIYIKTEEGNKAEPQEDNVFHPHVFCDGCNGPVYGIRYKCTVCPDYDLCSKCQAKGLHSEHSMMTITRPHCGGWMGYGVFTPPPFHGHHHGGHHHGGPHHGGPHHGGPHHGFPPRGPHPFGPRGKGPFGPGGFGKCWRAGVNMCHQTMKNFWQATNQPQADNRKEMPTGDAQKESQESATSANEEYLKTVGEHVAAMLDPLGINVEVDIEHGGVRQKCCGKGPHGAWATWEGCPCCEEGTDSSSAQTSADQKQDDDGKNDADVNMECGDTEATNKAAEQDTETGEAGTAAVTAEKGDSSPDRGWTFIDDGSTGAENTKASSHEPDVVNIDTNQTASPSDAEDKLTKALDHMKAMGFSDEGGWLTTLLKATDGDINKALDAIRANRQTSMN